MRGVSARRVRTTVRLPRPLYEEVQEFVKKELVAADSVNEFFVAAIRAYVRMIRRKQIDARFDRMAEDADYQKQAKLILEEFGPSDWEALELTDRELTEA
jgi:hypothetical protein